MQENYNTKDMTKSEKRRTAAIKSDTAKQKFFFAGGWQYKPVTIEAVDLAEATKIYEETKVEIN